MLKCAFVVAVVILADLEKDVFTCGRTYLIANVHVYRLGNSFFNLHVLFHV